MPNPRNIKSTSEQQKEKLTMPPEGSDSFQDAVPRNTDSSRRTVDVSTNRSRTSSQFGAVDQGRGDRQVSEEIFQQKIGKMSDEAKKVGQTLKQRIKQSVGSFGEERPESKF